MVQSSEKIPKRNVVPDRLDLRDRSYMPSIAVTPGNELSPKIELPVLNQGNTNACTGFALSNVVNFLLRSWNPKAPQISPYMLYSMAHRYDEFPGYKEGAGSSLCQAQKIRFFDSSNTFPSPSWLPAFQSVSR